MWLSRLPSHPVSFLNGIMQASINIFALHLTGCSLDDTGLRVSECFSKFYSHSRRSQRVESCEENYLHAGQWKSLHECSNDPVNNTRAALFRHCHFLREQAKPCDNQSQWAILAWESNVELTNMTTARSAFPSNLKINLLKLKEEKF